MFCFADKNDIPALCNLWKISFGDTDEYITNFLNRRFSEDNTVVFKENGVAVSMLFLLDGRMKIGKSTYLARYIYAACTHPDYRGRGLMSGLIEFAAAESAKAGYDFLCLTPAEPSLFGYYSRCGFVTSFVTKRVRVDRERLSRFADGYCEYKPAVSEIADLRNTALAESNAFLWDENAVSYALDETLLVGGKAVFTGKDRLYGYAFFHENKDTVFVKEIFVLNNDFSAVYSGLVENTSGKEFVIDCCHNADMAFDTTEVFDKAMLRPLNPDFAGLCVGVNGYMGLTLE